MSNSMSKQLIIDRLREQLAQAEADRDVLAAEVMAWREYERAMEETFPGHPQRFEAMKAVRHAKDHTNAAEALTR
jgi:hypothetical protein